LYDAGADIVVLGPPALWNKDANLEKAWSIMEKEIEEATRIVAYK
jgi:D-allulose-6-phosphate 3-epimerase